MVKFSGPSVPIKQPLPLSRSNKTLFVLCMIIAFVTMKSDIMPVKQTIVAKLFLALKQ